MEKETGPVFVLCCSRTGSTLLRYILDSHPDFCCPPEMHLARLAEALANVFLVTLGCGPSDRDENQENIIGKRVRGVIEEIMAEHLEPLGKKVWCEKSVCSIDHVGFLDLAFPSARYLCLYRSCLDQVASALEVLERDPTGKGYDFESHLLKVPGDPLNALVDYWLDKTEKVLAYENSHPDRCLRVRYEDIALDADAELEDLFGFLNSHWSQEMTASIFSRARKGGPGDHKILQTDAIKISSVGRGQNLVTEVSPDRQQKVDKLHAVLGYSPLTG